MERKTLIDLSILGCLLVSLGILGYTAIVFKTEAEQCYQNPLVYGVGKLSEANNADLILTGVFPSKTSTPIITITKYGMSVEFPNSPGRPIIFNESLFLDRIINES